MYSVQTDVATHLPPERLQNKEHNVLKAALDATAETRLSLIAKLMAEAPRKFTASKVGGLNY